MNKEDRDNSYPQDKAYRALLATHCNCSNKDLFPVIGPEELVDILKSSAAENFSVGKNFENTKNGLFKLNLHIHTYDSDGEMSVESLLNQAVDYANTLTDPPFIFTISNHDVLQDTINALKIISQDPEKFKNIYFVPGIELTAKYENNQLLHFPIQLEVLNYCVNPFDDQLIGYLDEVRSYNFHFAGKLFEQIRSRGLNLCFENAKLYHNLIKIGVSAAFIPLIKEYVIKEAEKASFDVTKIISIFDQYDQKYGTGSIPPKTPTIDELFKIVSTGMLGIAHPGRIQFYCNKDGVTNEQVLKALFNRFKELGGLLAEINYQYPENFFIQVSREWLSVIQKYSDQVGFLRAGGIDNHSTSLFVCRF